MSSKSNCSDNVEIENDSEVVEVEEGELLLTEVWSFSDNDSEELLSVSDSGGGKASGCTCGSGSEVCFEVVSSTQAALTILCYDKKYHTIKHQEYTKEI